MTNYYCFGMMQKIITLRLNLKYRKQEFWQILTDLGFLAVPNSTFSVFRKNTQFKSLTIWVLWDTRSCTTPIKVNFKHKASKCGKFPNVVKRCPWKVIFPRGYFFSSSLVFIKVIVMTHCYMGESGNAPTKHRSEGMGGNVY